MYLIKHIPTYCLKLNISSVYVLLLEAGSYLTINCLTRYGKTNITYLTIIIEINVHRIFTLDYLTTIGLVLHYRRDPINNSKRPQTMTTDRVW